jgi:hypothetical protein
MLPRGEFRESTLSLPSVTYLGAAVTTQVASAPLSAPLPPHPIPPPLTVHRPSLPDIQHQPVPIAPAIFQHQEVDPQVLRQALTTQTPPDLTVPITPMMPNIAHMDAFIPVTPYDQDGDNQFLALNSTHPGLMDFDSTNIIGDFTSPQSMFPDTNEHFFMNGKGMHTPVQVAPPMFDGSASVKSGMEHNSPYHVLLRTPAGLSPSNSTSSGLQEPDAVIASHHAWPFFQCNRVDKYSFFPPKTAHIYLEGLSQTLRNQATWQAWSSQIDERSLDIASERRILTEQIVGWSREKLLAITQLFLHKALDIHKHDRAGGDETPASPDSTRDTFLMLPPPDVMQYFLRSYAVRYEPYYSSVPAGRLDPNALMHSSNSRAASLLILLMVASGASATPTVEARYIASGLTEACRLSLFDSIEKDVMQSRDVLVLRAALLFICLAAWSGDKWHMDVSHPHQHESSFIDHRDRWPWVNEAHTLL